MKISQQNFGAWLKNLNKKGRPKSPLCKLEPINVLWHEGTSRFF